MPASLGYGLKPLKLKLLIYDLEPFSTDSVGRYTQNAVYQGIFIKLFYLQIYQLLGVGTLCYS